MPPVGGAADRLRDRNRPLAYIAVRRCAVKSLGVLRIGRFALQIQAVQPVRHTLAMTFRDPHSQPPKMNSCTSRHRSSASSAVNPAAVSSRR